MKVHLLETQEFKFHEWGNWGNNSSESILNPFLSWGFDLRFQYRMSLKPMTWTHRTTAQKLHVRLSYNLKEKPVCTWVRTRKHVATFCTGWNESSFPGPPGILCRHYCEVLSVRPFIVSVPFAVSFLFSFIPFLSPHISLGVSGVWIPVFEIWRRKRVLPFPLHLKWLLFLFLSPCEHSGG